MAGAVERVVTTAREAEAQRVLAAVERWAGRQAGVRAVAVVGSWARGEARMESDLDLVVLADDPDPYVTGVDWVAEAVGDDASLVRTMRWGVVLTERRLRLRSGLEVEFGFASPVWANTDPLDAGTADVVRNGCRALFDPERIVERLTVATATVSPPT
jgi:predicted nucleotidyltransferase